MASFFVDVPIEVEGRYVQRGFLLHGGVSSSDELLDDLWLFDSSNLGAVDPASAAAGTALCPWVNLSGGAGAPRSHGAMVWDEGGQRFVLAGGYEDESGELRAADDVFELLVEDLLVDPAWDRIADLPAVTYSATLVGDGEGSLVPPGGACSGTTGEVPCKWDSLAWVALLAAVYAADEDLVCDESGNLQEWEVDLWGTVDPCTGVVSCEYDGITYEEEPQSCTDQAGTSGRVPGVHLDSWIMGC